MLLELNKNTTIASLAFTLTLLAACASTYYQAMEGMGFEKRDILVDRVEEARDAQHKRGRIQFQERRTEEPCPCNE